MRKITPIICVKKICRRVFRHDGLKFKIYNMDFLSNSSLVSYWVCFKNLYKAQHLSLPHFVNCNGTACCECYQCCVCSETALLQNPVSPFFLFHRTIQASWYWLQEYIRKFNDFLTRWTMNDSWVKQQVIKYIYCDMDKFLYSNMFVPNFSINGTAQILGIKITTYSFRSKN